MAAPPSPSSSSGEIAVQRLPAGFGGGYEASPSRTELLSMVKKHSHLIGWTVVDAEDDASDVGMDDKFWHVILDLFFVRGRVSKRREEDDLVFFVNNMLDLFFVRGTFIMLELGLTFSYYVVLVHKIALLLVMLYSEKFL